MLKSLATLIAIGVVSLAAPADAQSRETCVKSCEQKCSHEVRTGKCMSGCMRANGCF